MRLIFSQTVREYDDQPKWRAIIYTADPPLFFDDVTWIEVKQIREDINAIYVNYEWYNERATNEIHTRLPIDDLIEEYIFLRNMETHKKYSIKEYEEYIKTHDVKEGGLVGTRRVKADGSVERKKRT